jgi:hypothetical protein
MRAPDLGAPVQEPNMRPTSRPAVRPVALALLLVLSALGSLPMATTANSSSPPADTIDVYTEPFPHNDFDNIGGSSSTFVFATPDAKSTDVTGQHYVRLVSRANQNINKVEFIWRLREQPADNCQTAPPPAPALFNDPCSSLYDIIWDADRSFARGWTVTADNTAKRATDYPAVHKLTFEGGTLLSSTSSMPPPTSQYRRSEEFLIAFTIRGSPPDGTQLPIQVIGSPGTQTAPNPPADYDTTCNSFVCHPMNANSPEPSFFIKIDAEPPAVSQNLETTPPRVGVITRDMDHDGHIDMLEVAFGDNTNGRTDNLNPRLFDFRDFHVLPAKGRTLPAGLTEYRIINAYFLPPSAGGHHTDRVNFILEEMPFYDTGDIVKFTYSPSGFNRVRDLAGNPMRSFSGSNVMVVDGAKPIITGAWGVPGESYAHVFFSEPVRGTGVDEDGNPDGSIALGDLYFRDDLGNSQGGNTMQCIQPSGTCSVSPPVGGIYNEFKFAPLDLKRSDRLVMLAGLDPGNPGYRYKIGALDAHPLTGDMIGPTAGAPPATCPMVRAPLDRTAVGPRVQVAKFGPPVGAVDFIDSAPCQTAITDLNGLTMYYDPASPTAPATRRLTYPLVTSVEMDVSHDLLTVNFNGPVQLANDRGEFQALVLSNFDVETAYTADPNMAFGPQGFVQSVFSVGASDKLLLRTDAPARAIDVSSTPSKLIVKCNTVQAASAFKSDPTDPENKESYLTRGLVPCDNPDRFGPYDPLGAPHANFVDETPPRIANARTVDGDRNGFLDGIELTFTEPVNDQSFRESSAETYELSCLDPATGEGPEYCPNIEPTLVVFQYDWTHESESRQCFGPYAWDTGEIVNDNIGILTAVRVTKDPETGAVKQGRRDCMEMFRGIVRPDRMLPTHALPNLRILEALVADQATPPNELPNHCSPHDVTWLEPVVGPSCPDSVFVSDGAPPVVLRARTVDTPAVDKDGQPQRDARLNIFGDGFIDGMRLTFSEPIVDTSFRPLDWKIGGVDAGEVERKVSGGRTADPGDPLAGILRNNDNEFTVLFEKGTVPDTDARPQLVYTLDPARAGGSGITDAVGNRMVSFAKDSVIEEDDAGPQIVAVQGFPGTNLVEVTFSEPVDDGAKNVLVQADFQYSNRNQGANDGASGKSGTKQICHGDGTPSYPTPPYDDPNTPQTERCEPRPLHKALVPLNKELTPDDIKNDRIQALPGQVFEIAPSVAVKKSVPDYFHGLAESIDVTPPGAILDLRPVEALTRANSVVLAWTAPGNDGNVGSVASYEVRLSQNVITPESFAEAIPPEGITWEMTPAPAVPAGQTQTARVIGLKPEQTYHFAVRAVDPAGNRGPVSQDVTATTGRDTTPPTGTLTVSSKEVKPGASNTARTATFTWNVVQDPESTVVYHYAINRNRDYQVLATDKSTTAPTATETFEDGEWTFHVAAFSGGGAGPTAHYTFTVGAEALTPDRIQEANDLVKVNAVRVGGLNIINWTLPDLAEMPPGVLEAVEIWRNDDGLPRLVATIPGSYEDLKAYNFTDVTEGANKDSRYRVNMVFASDQRQTDPLTGYQALTLLDPEAMPAWLFALIGIGLALVVAGLVIFFVLRRKQREAATGGLAYSWESANPDALGIDEATGLPLHNVKCPTCTTPFQAVGKVPLGLTCPNCGTTGTLD